MEKASVWLEPQAKEAVDAEMVEIQTAVHDTLVESSWSFFSSLNFVWFSNKLVFGFI